MLIYLMAYGIITLMGCIVLGKCVTSNRKKLFCCFAFMILAFLECLRHETIGEDTIAYINWFRIMSEKGWKNSFIDLGFYVEPGYKIVNLLIIEITKNERVLLIVTSILILGLHILYLKQRSKNIVISILLFIGCNFFLTSMTSIRQFIAMGIVFWIDPYMEKRKYGIVILLMIFAYMFHHSSLLFTMCFVFFWIVGNKTKNIKWIVLLEGISLVVFPVVLKFLLKVFPKYIFYFQYGEEAQLGKLREVYILIDIILIVWYCLSEHVHSRKNTVFAMLLSVSAYIGVLNQYVPHIFRLGYYFDYFLLLIIPELICKLNARNSLITKFIVYNANTALFLYYLATNAATTVPYRLM